MRLHLVRHLCFVAPALLALACRSAGPQTDWTAIGDELEQRVAEEEAVRELLIGEGGFDPDDVAALERIDASNTAWMKELVALHGWPTIQRVGADRSFQAWALVQNADRDVDFQEHCVELLRGAVARGEADPRTLAYLEDRVAMHRGRPQRYGTQYRQKSDGSLVPYTLEDEERVDELRASVGLGTLEEYERDMLGEDAE